MSINIPGLTKFEGPSKSLLQQHKFSVPAIFPSDKLAARWEEEGLAVLDAANPEIIPYARVQADGWKPWLVTDVEATAVKQKAAEGSKDKVIAVKVPYTRVIGKKKYVLLCRPIELQRAVSAIYGEESRARVNMEVKGERVTALEAHDEGILSDAKIRETGVDKINDDDPAIAEYRQANRRIGEVSDLNLAAQL